MSMEQPPGVYDPQQYSQTSIMRYFTYAHLPEPLQKVSARFADMAVFIDKNLPSGPEKTTALRKLLESKDAAVRAALDL